MEVNWWWLALLLLTLFASISIKWLFNYCLTLYRLPPGPWGLPVLGYLPWLSQQAFVDFARIGKRYGGLFSLRMGSEMAVVINDWPAVKATLVDRGRAFSGRKFSHVANVFAAGIDIAFTEGEVWLKQRNLAAQALKNVGWRNKKNVEARFMVMVHQLIDELKKVDGQVVTFEEVVQESFALGNWKIISGYDLVESKEELESLKKDMATFLHNIRLNNPVAALPWLRFLPPDGFGFWAYTRAMSNYRKYLRKLIQKHYDQVDSGSDFIDLYIDEIKKHPDRKPPYNDDHLMGTVTDLVSGSIETTFATILWGFLFLALNPPIQIKVQEELDRVVGRERLPTTEDFSNLPYLNAFILEVHRVGSVAPASVPHSTMETVHVNGFTIPKNTLCIQNIYAIHHDPDYWEEPEVFKPERFIMEDGTVKAPPYLIPFSVGSRTCLGQVLAEIELKLVFSCFLQQFTFSAPKDRPNLKLEPLIAFVRRPHPYALHVKCRN